MSLFDWQRDAACRGEDLVLFFGPDGERTYERIMRERRAIAVCAGCPVRNACLEYALALPEKYGMWGALNPDQRHRERRRRSRQPAPPTRVLVTEKQCGGCDVVHPAAAFSKDIRQKDGLTRWCKKCANEANRRRRREAKQAVAS